MGGRRVPSPGCVQVGGLDAAGKALCGEDGEALRLDVEITVLVSEERIDDLNAGFSNYIASGSPHAMKDLCRRRRPPTTPLANAYHFLSRARAPNASPVSAVRRRGSRAGNTPRFVNV